MSSLSDQQPGAPFSEYSELCKVPPSLPAQTWDWQHPTGMDVSPPRALVGGGGGALAAAGLTDEDKLCFFEQPGRVGVATELKVPVGRVGGMSGSPSLGNASLGSAGESPDSPLSSSPSPSPASPGKLPSVVGGGGIGRSSLPPVPGSPAHHAEVPSHTHAEVSSHTHDEVSSHTPHALGATLTPALPPSELWKDSGPKVAMPQVAPNYCITAVANDNHLERGNEGLAGAGAGLGARQLSEDSSGDDSKEEEAEGEEELEPCLMGRAQQQRKAMRRAMSDCSHLAVPTTLDLPDKYPGGDGVGPDQLVSPVGGPRRSPHSMKRSLTVAEDQAPAPPPTLSAAGATHTDLRESPPELRLFLSPFPPLRDSSAGFPLSPVEPLLKGFRAEKEPGGMVLPVPPGPTGSGRTDSTSDVTGYQTRRSEDEGLGDVEEMEVHTGGGVDFGSGVQSAVAGALGGGVGSGRYPGLGWNPSTNPFLRDGRYKTCPQLDPLSVWQLC